MNRGLAPIVVVLVGISGCSGTSTPTSPDRPGPSVSTTSPAGNWSGFIQDSVSGDGTVQMSLIDEASNGISGKWSATFRNGDRFSGAAVGGLSGSGYSVALSANPISSCDRTPAPPLLSLTMVNIAVGPNQLVANLVRVSCNAFGGGNVVLSRQ